MRLYIAGPMTGYQDLNFPAFHAETARLRELGYEVINPAEINPDPNAGWIECMKADLRELLGCHAIVLLAGWAQSRGATFEHHVASSLGLDVFREGELIERRAA